MSYGKFSKDFTEYEIHTPNPIHAIDNYLWNEKVFSHVTQTGLGYIWYDHQGTEITQVSPGSVCETVYDKHYSRLIYIRDNDTGRYWNLNWEPVLEDITSFSCVQGLGYTKISSVKNSIRGELTVFVPPGSDPLEIWRLRIINLKEKPRDISVFTFNEISLESVDTYGELIYMHGEFDKRLNGIVSVKRAETLPHDHFSSFFVTDHRVSSHDCSKESFVGRAGMLNKPAALARGKCLNSIASFERPVTVLHLRMKLNPKSEKQANFLFGVADNRKTIRKHIIKYFHKNGIEKEFKQLRKEKTKLNKINTVHSPDARLNMLTNIWNKHQIDYGSSWSRWGWRGYRDVVQNTMALPLIRPDKAREKLLTALRYQYHSGWALRGWCPVDEKPYSDNALWLIFAVVKYLQETGDLDMLRKSVPFFDKGRDTVYKHLIAAVDFCWKHRGRHGMSLIEFGDWNDSLTQVGRKGRGEGVLLTMMLFCANAKMIRITEKLNDTKRTTELRRRQRILKKVLNEQAWEDDRYIRAYDDEGLPIGSKSNKEGKIYLSTQAWALLGRIVPDDRIDMLVNTIDKKLLTKVGYMVLSPCYKKYHSNIGRITNMEPGIAENGTIYSHSNGWIIRGYLQQGLADKAYDIYRRIAPAYHSLPQEKTGAVPYVFSNCYFGPEHYTKPYLTEYSWITGSVPWFFLDIIEWMFGLRSDYDGLLIEPCLPSKWKKCSAQRTFRGKTFDVHFERKAHEKSNSQRIILNGKPIEGNLIRIEECRKNNKVEVYWTEAL